MVEGASGPAAHAGLQQGDVLLAINGSAVSSVAEARAVVANADKSLAPLVQRGSEKLVVPVRLG